MRYKHFFRCYVLTAGMGLSRRRQPPALGRRMYAGGALRIKICGKTKFLWGKVARCGEFYLPLPKRTTRRTTMRFLGNIEAKTDSKGRVFLPAAFRKELQAAGEERLVLRKDIFQPCLVIYPGSVWNVRLDSLRQRLNRWDAAHQRVFRQFVADAEAAALDSNGRLLLAKRHLAAVGISQDVRFIGMDDTIEVWSGGAVEASFMGQEEFGRTLESLMGAGGGPASVRVPGAGAAIIDGE